MHENLVQLSVAIGVFFPLLVALVKQAGWSTGVNAVVALVSSAVAGFVTAYLAGTVSWDTWGESAVAIWLASGVAYATLWKPTGVNDALKNSTSVVKA